MALSRILVPGTWAGLRGASIAAGAQVNSDIVIPPASCVGITVTLEANNGGTAVLGDILSFYLAATSGDAYGSTTDNYAAETDNMHILGSLDTFLKAQDSIDVKLPYAPYKYRIVAVSEAATNPITVAFTTQETRST